MATKWRAVVMPVRLVGAFTELARRDGGGHAHRGRFLGRRRRRARFDTFARSLAHQARTNLPALPSPRRRRRMLKKARKRFGSLAGVANGVATMASIVAAGMELASALRSPEVQATSGNGESDNRIDERDESDTDDLGEVDDTAGADDVEGSDDLDDVEGRDDTDQLDEDWDERDDVDAERSEDTAESDLEEGELQHVG